MLDNIKEYLLREDVQQMAMSWGTKILIALVILIIGRMIARMIVKGMRRFMHRREMEHTLADFLGDVLYAILFTAVIVAALQYAGVPMTSFLAILGAAGLAIGLALKDSLGNFAAGIMIVAFRPFTRGDVVEVAGVAGKVDDVDIFSTDIITADNKKIIVPNGQIMANPITNHTAKDIRRVDLIMGVGYDDNLKTAKELLLKICKDHPLILDDPATSVFVMELAASSVNFAVRPWCKTGDYWTVWGDLQQSCKEELEAAGLSIPYPQQDVYLHKVESSEE